MGWAADVVRDSGTGEITGVVYQWNTGEKETYDFNGPNGKLARFLVALGPEGGITEVESKGGGKTSM
ncbi:hypothetical protein [Chachezhania sediminis]|uniref:hypothetical protein n=1 Tax=Chachezhania sediminis TaxID=2599291 RepID=UPI00131D8F9B|nr:hypothetical protein [Chachezhania sediminis]